jgi:hypothetical protein
MANGTHRWSFFRAGGFDQVRIDSGQDIVHLAELDQKLWVALACPTKGLEFNSETLTLLDTDKDGRIRAPEILAATKWVTSILKNPDDLLQSKAALPLAAINDSTPDGKAILASAKQILSNLGKADATEISPEQTADTTKIFANTTFNGDGIVPADATTDANLQAIITDIIKILGAETDRSGKPGINQKKLELFFADAQAFLSWHDKSQASDGELPLGPNSAAAAATIKAVATKIDDYFTRCRLAAFDPRATAAVNRAEADYAALGSKDLSAAAAEIGAFPLAKVAPDASLPLKQGINPAWQTAIAALYNQAIKPLLGEKDSLSEAEWAALVAKFAPVDSWLAAKAGATVEPLGIDRIRAIVQSPQALEQIAALIERDASLASEANLIAAVHKLVHYHRDLYKLLLNFVNFRDFYSRKAKAVFQVGTLYLDQRSCELCVRADDPARHSLMAHMSRSYLAYCDLSRKKPDGTVDKMSIAAAITAGDSDDLMVGRNGIFYDRDGNDWDATITKIMENPISIRQAFLSPYKRAIRFINDQLAKRAAAADAAATERLQTSGVATATAAAPGAPAAPIPAPVAKPKIDIGTLAAIGLVLSSVVGFMTGIFLGFLSLGIYMPLGILAVILLISGPSMIIAWFKLRMRNLGPILDANGWAVNAKAKLNIPFGRSLTQMPKLPAGSQRNTVDPYAEKHPARNWTIIILSLLLALWLLWFFGQIEKVAPNLLPKSNYMLRQEQAQQEKEARRAAEVVRARQEEAAKKAGVVLPVVPATAPSPKTPPTTTATTTTAPNP